MTAKTHYNIKLIRAALTLVPSEITPETVAAPRLDSCQIEPETLPETWPRQRWPWCALIPIIIPTVGH